MEASPTPEYLTIARCELGTAPARDDIRVDGLWQHTRVRGEVRRG